MCYGQNFQSDVVIKKTKCPDKPFTNGFYIILRLCYLQVKIIVFMFLLMETPKNS